MSCAGSFFYCDCAELTELLSGCLGFCLALITALSSQACSDLLHVGPVCLGGSETRLHNLHASQM